ncbi:Imm6 family immunity protein [Priestia endophytica]|uniref:Imm6 family immunity protein n=1 Tax=Priestia endophytica TaxID=135735 RepID=UPI00227E9D72|nr:Imm6 family immunity protein [Priestia endophytica]MCY8233881.1 Imm6 family immunity protein [Priestia endophytica]
MNFIHDLTAESKVATGLIIAEKLFYIIKSKEPGYQTGREALDDCWKWLAGENVTGDYLYNYIDSGDYIDITEFANDEEDRLKQHAWYAVLDGVSYTIYQAYQNENVKIVPQAMESINDDTLKTLGENAMESGLFNFESINNIKTYILESYSSGSKFKRPISLTLKLL